MRNVGRRALRLLAWALAMVHLCIGTLAHAESSEADRLFLEGRQLLKEGRWEEACARLTESQRLDPSSGTLMNLGHCHEQLGKYATAFSDFNAAEKLAESQQAPQRQAEAQRRAAAVRTRLSFLRVHVGKPVAGLEVEQDGAKLDPTSFDQPMPIDPGSHTVRAVAPGYVDWTVTLTVVQPGELVVNVPELRSVSSPPAQPVEGTQARPTPLPPSGPPRDRAPSAEPKRGLPAGFWIAAGTTALATGVTTVAGVLSLSNYREGEKGCNADHRECSDEAMSLRSKANTQAKIADVALGTAVVAAGVGVYYLVTSGAPSGPVGSHGARRSGARTPALAWTW